MDFSNISRTSLIGRSFRASLRLLPSRAKVPILQGRLRGRKWIVGSSSHGCWLGSYEHDIRELVEKYVSEGSVVYDVGAHVGFYTLLTAVLVGESGKVIAFEPAPRNLSYLRRHLSLNKITNVEVVEAAVSEQEGSSWFNTGVHSARGRISEEGAFKVRTVSLDQLVRQGAIPYPDVIKMDVEGGELRALRGARELLEQKRIVFFLSTHRQDLHDDCCSLLRSLKYDLHPLHGTAVAHSSEILALPR